MKIFYLIRYLAFVVGDEMHYNTNFGVALIEKKESNFYPSFGSQQKSNLLASFFSYKCSLKIPVTKQGVNRL